MELAVHFEMQRPERDDHRVVEETLEQCILADEVGFDYLWFVEHHFLTGFSTSPCPEVLFGALSRLTKRIRLGFGVVILPYHHPVRVAERVAMLDQMSHGRVDLGTGRSAPYEQLGMGIDPRHSRDMWEESIRMIPKIWESDIFQWEGRFWNVPPREVLPKPYQKPHPPIWVAALQPSTYQLAAEMGIGVMSFGSNAPEVLEPHIRTYRQKIREAKPVGAVVNNRWQSQTLGYCGEDNKEARELVTRATKTFFGPDKPYIQDQKNVYAGLLQNWGGIPEHLSGAFKIHGVTEGQDGEVQDQTGYEAVAYAIWEKLDADTLCDRGVLIGGDPESCIKGLKLHEQAGVDQVNIVIQTETIPHEKVMKSIELFGKYVLPEFKKSKETATTGKG